MTLFADISGLPESQRPYGRYVDRQLALIDHYLIAAYSNSATLAEEQEAAYRELCGAVAPADPCGFRRAVDSIVSVLAVDMDHGTSLERDIEKLIRSAPNVVARSVID